MKTPFDLSRLQAITVIASLGAGLLTASAASAVDLLESFELARTNDPVFLGATYEKLAQDNSLYIAWSSLLPSASAEASYIENRQVVQSSDNEVFAGGTTSFPVKSYGASLTQPLFRMTDWAEVSQARAGVRQAAAELDLAYQDLVFRTADAYLSVLEAREEYEIRLSERDALRRQSEISQRRLDSGIGTAPDVYEAEARSALAEADEAIAGVAVQDASQALAEITGRLDEDLRPLTDAIPLAPPEPANPDAWVRTAVSKSPALEARRQAIEVADREIDKQRGAHMPTIDFTASINNRDTDGSLFGGGSQVETSEYGVQVRVPIFSGGATIFGTRRARDLHRKNQQDLVQARRQVERETRNAFQAVGSPREVCPCRGRHGHQRAQCGTRTLRRTTRLLAWSLRVRARRAETRTSRRSVGRGGFGAGVGVAALGRVS
ncbi:MAG: TolC family protein [Deltaproteobacteria bacterium]|nr:TolC family protein [Deltaproteobacteria bacterium]